jgi:DNA-binding NarL/FixJ family response regulator
VKGTVLLVEDERDTRELLARAIERADWRCVTAASVDEARDRAADTRLVDVVVTDVVLANDDRGGLRILGELRARGVRAPVVIITAYADVEKVKLALNGGAAYLLEKPFRAPELIDAIERVRDAGGDGGQTIEHVLARANLTLKERTVARLLLDGLSAGEIAEREHNSAKTIRQHISQIYAKCGVVNRAEFFRVVYAR